MQLINFTVDNTALQNLRLLTIAIADPKIHDKASRAGYRAQLSKVVRNLKRETRNAGYREVARAVGSQLRVRKNGFGRDYTGRVGIKRRNRRYAAIWHLLNLGAKPHTVVGPHPGFTGKNMRDRAARPTSQELTTVWWKAFERTYGRELRKRGRR